MLSHMVTEFLQGSAECHTHLSADDILLGDVIRIEEEA